MASEGGTVVAFEMVKIFKIFNININIIAMSGSTRGDAEVQRQVGGEEVVRGQLTRVPTVQTQPWLQH